MEGAVRLTATPASPGGPHVTAPRRQLLPRRRGDPLLELPASGPGPGLVRGEEDAQEPLWATTSIVRPTEQGAGASPVAWDSFVDRGRCPPSPEISVCRLGVGMVPTCELIPELYTYGHGG